MKYLLIYFILTYTIISNAQINVLCGNGNATINCQSVSSSLLSTRSRQVLTPTGEGYRPSAELMINNFNNDIVNIEADINSPSGLVSVLTNNKGSKAEYKITANGSLNNGISKNADDINLFGDMFGKIDINISGYQGLNGRTASQLCLNKVDQGFYGNTQSDDAIRQYRASSGAMTCDSGILSSIADFAPVNFCPSGYSYRPDLHDSTTQSFLVNRRKFMNECVKTQATCNPNTNEGCINSNGSFNPSFVYKSIGNACPLGYSSSGPTQDYPCPHEGDDQSCTNNAEDVLCSTDSCPTGILKKSFQTVYGSTITREAGESGSFGGRVNLLVYDVDTVAVKYNNGSNGLIGLNDLTEQTSFTKYCARVLDNRTEGLEETSPERNVPSVNLHVVTFYPLKILDPSGLPNVLFPVKPESEAIGLFKKVDSAVRDFVFKTMIVTAP